MLFNIKTNQTVADNLRTNPDIRRVAGFGSSKLSCSITRTIFTTFSSGQFAYYFPKIYHYYSTNLRRLYRDHSHLTPNFCNSIFPACTFNMGPDVATWLHADTGNYFGGGCPIYCGGEFDPKLGGHLILWDLKLVIEFPPGSTIIIPSSSLTHGNTPIQPGETRVSFTQYCAGGLFRWVKYGYQTFKTCAEQDPDFKKEMDGKAEGRWRRAMGRFSKLNELHVDRKRLFKSRSVQIP